MIISIPAPLFKRGGHFVARFLHFCCRWRKKRAARGGFARSGALGLDAHAEPGSGIAAQNRDAQRNRGSSLHSERAKRGARGLALQLSGALVCVDENVHTRNLMSKKESKFNSALFFYQAS